MTPLSPPQRAILRHLADAGGFDYSQSGWNAVSLRSLWRRGLVERAVVIFRDWNDAPQPKFMLMYRLSKAGYRAFRPGEPPPEPEVA